MEFTQLKQFKTVAETENIIEAGKILNISQPALTKSIKNLETELQAPLFDRINKKLILNEVGQIVLKYVNEMFTDLNDMRADLNYVQSNKNLIRICSAINALTTHLIPQFNIEHPEIETYPQLRPANKYISYLMGDIFDIALSQIKLENEYIESKALVKDWVVISVAKGDELYNKKFIDLTDLSNREFISSAESFRNPLPRLFEQTLETNGIEIIKKYYASTQAAVYEAQNSNKLMYINSIGAKFHDYGSHRRYIPINVNENLAITYYASYLKEKKSNVDIFVKWMQKQFDSYSQLFNINQETYGE